MGCTELNLNIHGKVSQAENDNNDDYNHIKYEQFKVQEAKPHLRPTLHMYTHTHTSQWSTKMF